MQKISNLLKKRPKFSILALILFCLIFAGAGIYLIYQSRGASTLFFNDDFTSAPLNSNIWQVLTPFNTHHVTGEAQYYKDSNLSFVNSGLRITTKKETYNGYNYTSGMITSLSTPKVSYGYYETRAKLPKGRGVWPAFWLTNDAGLEIDVFELLGHEPNKVYMTLHRNGSQVFQATYTGPDFSADYHTFAVDWQPSYIKWYVDGIKRAEFLPSMKGWSTIPADPLWVLANTAVGTSSTWPGAPDSSTVFPQIYDIDYIKGYTSKPVVSVDPPADTVPPLVNFTAPTNGALLLNPTTVSANATDNVAVSKVEFYLDNVLKNTDTASPYGYSLDITGLASGQHIMVVKATDTSGLTDQAQITVNVGPIVPPPPPDTGTDPVAPAPTVEITSPVDGSTISVGKACISVTAVDTIRISTISYYIDGRLISTQTVAPYRYCFNSKKYKAGAHVIKSVLTDIQGRTATDQVTIYKR